MPDDAPAAEAAPERPSGQAGARLELVLAALCFGAMAVLARRLGTGAGRFSPGQLAVIRFAVGAAACGGLFAVRPSLLAPTRVGLLLLRGVSGGLVVVLYFVALGRIPAGEAGVIYNGFPVLASLLGLALLGERPAPRLWAGLVLATAGVLLVLGRGGLALGLGWGEGAAFAAAGFAALSAVLIRSMRASEGAFTIFFFFCLAGLPVALPFAVDPWPRAPAAWLVALAMALLAFAGQVLMTAAYGRLTVGEAAAWLQLTPIAQALFAAILLGERLTLASALGVLIGAGGVALASSAPPPRAQRAKA